MTLRKKEIPTTSTIRPSRYGATLAEFASYVARTEKPERDLCYQVAYNLAQAYIALQRLLDQGAPALFNGRPLVWPYLDAAWRELLYIRSGLRADQLDTSILTRYGRLTPSVGDSLQMPEQDKIPEMPVLRPKAPRLRHSIHRRPYRGLR